MGQGGMQPGGQGMGMMPGGMPGMMPGAGALPFPAGLAMPGLPSPMIGGGGVSQPGPWVQNQLEPELDLMPADPQLSQGVLSAESDKDVDEFAGRSFIEEPWFAKLPLELRQAIRSNAQRRAPRGYEERLKRYFESVD